MFFASVGAVVGSLLPWVMASIGVLIDRAFGGSQRFGEVRVLRRRDAAHFRSVLVRVHHARVCARGARQVRWPRHREFAGQVARQDAAPRLGLARVGSRWPRRRVLSPMCAPRSTCSCSALSYMDVFLLTASRLRSENAFTTILGELDSMSASMRWLALVQFCSWFTLFTIFIYTTPAVAKLHFGSSSSRIRRLRSRGQLGGRAVRAPTTAWRCSPR